MGYFNSQQHLENLARARARTAVPTSCKFCSVIKQNRAAATNHELSCYLNPNNLRHCCVCSKPIKKYKYNATCSHGCANTLFRSGPEHPNWDQNSYISTCFFYHRKKCVVCGESNIVEVHHLDENSKNNNPQNLIPLCPTHHQYWHSRFRNLVEAKVLRYIKKWKSKSQVQILSS